jgi:hypothetical protein
VWTASKLSRFCAHHHLLSDLNPRPTRDKAAAKGTAFHAAIKDWMDFGAIPAMSDPDVMEWLRTMVDKGWSWPDGAELEKCWGLSTWGTFAAVEETAPGSHEYKSLDGEDLLTAGRSDATWPHGDLIVSCDWKTGRTMAPPARINLQVNAAGIAHCQRWKKAGYIPIVYYARSGIWDPGDEVLQGSDEWIAMLAEIEAAAALDDKPHPGPHCSDCWERKNCEAA